MSEVIAEKKARIADLDAAILVREARLHPSEVVSVVAADQSVIAENRPEVPEVAEAEPMEIAPDFGAGLPPSGSDLIGIEGPNPGDLCEGMVYPQTQFETVYVQGEEGQSFFLHDIDLRDIIGDL